MMFVYENCRFMTYLFWNVFCIYYNEYIYSHDFCLVRMTFRKSKENFETLLSAIKTDINRYPVLKKHGYWEQTRNSYIECINNTVDKNGNTIWQFIMKILNDYDNFKWVHEDILEVLDFLLRQKMMDLNPKDIYLSNKEETPLHSAIRYGNKEIAELLIANHADINARNRNDANRGMCGETPLHIAIRYGKKEIAELLLANHHANVNTRNRDDDTPLLTAMSLHVPPDIIADIINLLLRHSADPNARSRGLTPLEIICSQSEDSTEDPVKYRIAEMFLFFDCDLSWVTVQRLQRFNERMEAIFIKNYIRILKPLYKRLPRDAFQYITARIMSKAVYDFLHIEDTLRDKCKQDEMRRKSRKAE